MPAYPPGSRRRSRAFREDPELVLCATDYERVAPSGVVTHLGQPPPTHAALAVALLTGNRLRHSSAMFRRDAALKLGGMTSAGSRWRTTTSGSACSSSVCTDRFPRSPSAASKTPRASLPLTSTNKLPPPERERKSPSDDGRVERLGGDAPTMLPGHDAGAGTPRVEVRALADAVGGITRDLKRRGIRRCGAYSQALAIAMGLYVGQPRLTRHWAILRASPALYTRGRIERRRWRRR